MSRAAQRNRAEGEELAFPKISTHANQLGLYAEETGLTGEQLGHFPQIFRHLALIGTVINLGYQLGYGTGNVAAARFRSLVPNMLEHLRWGA